MEQNTRYFTCSIALPFISKYQKILFFHSNRSSSRMCTRARTRPVREMHNREVRRWVLWDASKTWWRGITVWDRDLGSFPCALRGAPELLKYETKRSENTDRQGPGETCKISALTWSIVLIYFLLLYPSLKFSLKKKQLQTFPTLFLPLWSNGSSFFSHSRLCLGYWMWFPVKLIPQVPSDLLAAGHGSLGRRKPRQAALQWGNSHLSNRTEEAAPKYHWQLLRTNY